jgi:hypothetical protein
MYIAEGQIAWQTVEMCAHGAHVIAYTSRKCIPKTLVFLNIFLRSRRALKTLMLAPRQFT